MKRHALEEILEDLHPVDTQEAPEIGHGRGVTIWLSATDKARYDRLQKLTKRKFAPCVRTAIRELMTLAEAKLS